MSSKMLFCCFVFLNFCGSVIFNLFVAPVKIKCPLFLYLFLRFFSVFFCNLGATFLVFILLRSYQSPLICELTSFSRFGNPLPLSLQVSCLILFLLFLYDFHYRNIRISQHFALLVCFVLFLFFSLLFSLSASVCIFSAALSSHL